MEKTYQRIFILAVFLFNSTLLYPAPTSSPARIKVDGISANTQVVVTNRNPVFSWDFTFDTNTDQDIVEIQIGTSSGASDVWDFSSTLLVTYKVYDGTTQLVSGTTYYWQIRITDNGSNSSGWVSSTFHTISSAVSLSSSKADLKIDWNNPFNPYKGQITKIRYQLIDSNENENIIIRVYTVNGELVVTLAEHLAEQKALYTVEWDGRNAEGEIVASGVYLVNLKAGTSIQKTKRVVVIK